MRHKFKTPVREAGLGLVQLLLSSCCSAGDPQREHGAELTRKMIGMEGGPSPGSFRVSLETSQEALSVYEHPATMPASPAGLLLTHLMCQDQRPHCPAQATKQIPL